MLQIVKYIFRFYRNMPLTYTDFLAHFFGSAPFTTGEFSRRSGNPRAAKVLSELKHRGVVERLGRGRYRCLGPAERPDLREVEWNRVRTIALSGPSPKAWTAETAVESWTGGRYVMSPSLFTRVFHLAVPIDKLAEWHEHLARTGASTRVRKRIGGRIELHPVKKVRFVTIHGEPVIPRAEVLRLIRNHPALYGNAGALLSERPSNAR